jgi:hypothetical protein
VEKLKRTPRRSLDCAAVKVLASAVVTRHGVPKGPEGLSPMQTALLNQDGPVVLASAPTGSGKSHVYRRAVEMGERVLFIVPTRRLAANQAAALREDMGAAGWPERDVAEKIAVFTADASAKLRDAGVTSVDLWRRSRLPQLRPGHRGEIIFTSPEALSQLMLNPWKGDGLGDIGPAILMKTFDRIVFDEFHLIGSRGFGLVSLVAGLAVAKPWGPAPGRVSLLSATPVDPLPVLERLGVPREAVQTITEEILTGRDLLENQNIRMLHGGVCIEFVEAESPLDILREMDGEITDLPDGRTATLIYDTLNDLQRDKDGIMAFAERIGLGPGRYFIDNSIDAQATGDEWRGRSRVIEGRRLVAATSTIEVGVTLPGLVLQIMDPGFTPLSFMQRFGRVARGHLDGRVIVRVTKEMLGCRPWLRALVTMIGSRGGGISIQELSVFMAEQARLDKRFAIPDGAAEMLDQDPGDPDVPHSQPVIAIDYFDSLSVRAAFTAGLYWKILIDRMRERGHPAHVKAIATSAPKLSWVLRGWIEAVGNGRLEGGKTWIEAFERAALNLRDFAPTVRVIGCDGQAYDVSEVWLVINTIILDDCQIYADDKGRAVVHLRRPIDWRRLLRPKGERGHHERDALLPYRKRSFSIGLAPVERFAEAARRLEVGLTTREKAIVRQAVRLVELTGIIPYID